MAPIGQDGQELVRRRETLARREVADIIYLPRKVRRRTWRTWPPINSLDVRASCQFLAISPAIQLPTSQFPTPNHPISQRRSPPAGSKPSPPCRYRTCSEKTAKNAEILCMFRETTHCTNLYPPFARGEKSTINVESCDVVSSTLGAITYMEHVIVCRDTVPLYLF